MRQACHAGGMKQAISCRIRASLALACAAFWGTACLGAEVEPESAAARDQRMAWFREARFGLFIHWGVSSVPAGEWQG
jgi:hypothetical protein